MFFLGLKYKADLPGIVFKLVTVFIGDFISISADKATGGTDVAGAANSITAGNAIATTAAVASVDLSL